MHCVKHDIEYLYRSNLACYALYSVVCNVSPNNMLCYIHQVLRFGQFGV